MTIGKSIVDAKAFSQALSKVSKMLKPCAIPVLAEVKVEVKDNRCFLCASDLSAWLTVGFPACGDDISFVLTRTRDVERACRRFDGELLLSLVEDSENRRVMPRLTMQCGSRGAEFDVYSAADYPECPATEPTEEFIVNAAGLLERIERVGYATDADAYTRRAASGCVQFSGNHIFALDGCTLSCDTDEGLRVPQPFMVKADHLAPLKIFGEQTITVRLGKRWLEMTDGAMTLQARRETDTVYDLQSITADRHRPERQEFLLSPKELIGELDYLKAFAPTNAKPYVRFCGGELYLPAAGNKYRTRVEIAGHCDIPFAFDYRRMKDIMKQFKDEPLVKLSVGGSAAPVYVEAGGRNDFALLCPVRMKDEIAA